MKRKSAFILFVLFLLNLTAVSCSTGDKTVSSKPASTPTEEPLTVITPTKKPAAATSVPDKADQEAKPEHIATAEKVSEKIPDKYCAARKDYSGTIQEITYKTFDYFGDGSEITKPAFVYLPYQYDDTKQYNVLYLMHGIGGTEREWGMYDDSSMVKRIMDNLIYYDEVAPFIIVVPNGRSCADYENTSSDYNSFYLFGQELRNDLIPYIEATFATYANYQEDGYEMTLARDHRAMAGLSMGGMQTINIGMCECLDIISYFGAFSACPTTNTAAQTAGFLKNFKDYNINYFYSICGTTDTVAWQSSTASTSDITSLTDQLEEDTNYKWQEIDGGVHDFNVWYPGFYYFSRLVFQ